MAVELENSTLQKVLEHLKKAEETPGFAIGELQMAVQYLLVWAVAAEKRLPNFPGMGI